MRGGLATLIITLASVTAIPGPLAAQDAGAVTGGDRTVTDADCAAPAIFAFFKAHTGKIR